MNEVGREVDGMYYEETPVLERLSTKGFQKKMGGWEVGMKRSPAIAVITGLLIKDGGLLLSRIALQYHRRRRA